MGRADAWMPFYVADYLRDTTHLSSEQHGAYLLLIMACWTRGGTLPDDDVQLASMAKMSKYSWKKSSETLKNFFQKSGEFLIHKRVVAEAEKAKKLREIRSGIGKLGGRPQTNSESKTKPIGFANGNQNETPSPSPSPTEVEEKKEDAPHPRKKASPKAPPAVTGTRLPDDWEPDKKLWDYAAERGFTADQIDDLAEDFRLYWGSQAGARGRMVDWGKVWMRRIRDRMNSTNGKPPHANGHRPDAKQSAFFDKISDIDRAMVEAGEQYERGYGR